MRWGWCRASLGLSVAVVLIGCGLGVARVRHVLYVPHAPVNAAQVTALELTAARHEGVDGTPVVEPLVCSVHVMGARRTGTQLHVWAAGQCMTPKTNGSCAAALNDFAFGVAADLEGTRVSDAEYDDTIDGSDHTYEHAYFPRGLWDEEYALADHDGVADGVDLRAATKKLGGCST